MALEGGLTSDSDSNITIMQGDTVQVNCCCKKVRWYFYPHNSANFLRIFNGFEQNPDFQLRHVVINDISTGQSTLRISGVSTNDTGLYACLELYTNRNRLDFHLTVLGIQTHLFLLVHLAKQSAEAFVLSFINFEGILAYRRVYSPLGQRRSKERNNKKIKLITHMKIQSTS